MVAGEVHQEREISMTGKGTEKKKKISSMPEPDIANLDELYCGEEEEEREEENNKG